MKEGRKQGWNEGGWEEGRERNMELCMKHNSNANIWHENLFTGLTNTVYQICYFLPSSKLTFHIICFHGKLQLKQNSLGEFCEHCNTTGKQTKQNF